MITSLECADAEDFVLRPVAIADLDFLFKARNHPDIISLSASKMAVTIEEHTKWFHHQMSSGNKCFFVIQERMSGDSCGYVRIDPDGIQGCITVVLLPGFQGRGWGSVIVPKVVEMAKAVLPHVKFLNAEIQKGNDRSISVFKKAGFVFKQSQKPGSVTEIWTLVL